MTSGNITTERAWAMLQDAFRRDIRRPVKYEGADWYQITPEERKVFGISLASMPPVVTAYRYYEEVLDLTDTDILPPAVIAVIRQDVAHRFGMKPQILCHSEFENFAKLFGISRRTAHAWFIKHEFWCVRRGIQSYEDDDAGFFY